MIRGLATTAATATAIALALAAAPAMADEARIEAVPVQTAKRVFTPADFTQFAPRNALDMLVQVPGFSIRETEQGRGLGQADGNVLVNSKRLTSKSDGIETQLTRIPVASVERIELVDAATLDVPGLTGLVANIVAKTDAFSGQFYWSPRFRAHYAAPLWTRAEVSVSGKTGAVDYTLSLSNTGAGRGAAGGPSRITDAAGLLTEQRIDIFRYQGEAPKLTARIGFDGPGSSVGNLGVVYQRTYETARESSRRESVNGFGRTRYFEDGGDTWNYEISGDYEFALGPGRLKLIGLDRRSHEPYRQTVITVYDDGRPSTGDLFRQTGEVHERIARGEYGWKMLGGDWQLAGEAAFNRLGNVAALGTLGADGAFSETPFPAATGGVNEDRYEGSLSFSRALSPKLSFQAIAGAEKSNLSQTGANGLTRSFFRPKGSLSLAWKPRAGFDLSAKLERRVGQLSFYDFLAKQFFDTGNQNSGNADLKPQQDWTLEIEANKTLGKWGSTKLRFIGREVEDYVTVVPVGADGESIGNVPRAHLRILESNTTLQLEQLGWKGARLDLYALFQFSRLPDPLTGRSIPYGGITDRQFDLSLRYDIPASDWAVGGDVNYQHLRESYRLGEVSFSREGPVFAGVFVENKDVFGLTVRAEFANLLNARNRFDRTVYAGRRDTAPILFVESRNRLIGPIFKFEVKGSF
jgi:hypothetical protein